MRHTLMMMGALLALTACTGEDTTTPEPPHETAKEQPKAPEVDPRVVKAAAIARAADADPASVDKALADNGMSVDDYDALMYDIAADPALSAAFKAERAKK